LSAVSIPLTDGHIILSPGGKHKHRGPPTRSGYLLTGRGRLTVRCFCGTISPVVLDGELAVPCTRNPP